MSDSDPFFDAITALQLDAYRELMTAREELAHLNTTGPAPGAEEEHQAKVGVAQATITGALSQLASAELQMAQIRVKRAEAETKEAEADGARQAAHLLEGIVATTAAITGTLTTLSEQIRASSSSSPLSAGFLSQIDTLANLLSALAELSSPELLRDPDANSSR